MTFNELKKYFPLVALTASVIVFAFTTFATVDMVDSKHDEAMDKMDRIVLEQVNLRNSFWELKLAIQESYLNKKGK